MDTTKAPHFDGTQLCAQTDPDLFFYDTRQEMHERVPAAKKICEKCHLKDPCLDYALETDVQGVWGGTTLSERKLLRKERNLPPPRYMAKELDDLLRPYLKTAEE